MQTVERPRSMYRDDLIRAQIAAKQLTTGALVGTTGLSSNTISKIRNGNNKVKLASLAAIAAALEIKLGELFEPVGEEAGKAA